MDSVTARDLGNALDELSNSLFAAQVICIAYRDAIPSGNDVHAGTKAEIRRISNTLDRMYRELQKIRED